MKPAFYLGREKLKFTKGLPVNYSGTVIQYSESYHSSNKYGDIVIQEIIQPSSIIRLKSFNFRHNKQLIHSHELRGITCTTSLSNHHRETIKGIGKIILTEQNYAAVFSQTMDSLINIRRDKYVETLDCFCDEQLLHNTIPADHPIWKDISLNKHVLPVLLTQPCRVAEPMVKEMLDHLQYFPLDRSLYEAKMRDLMEQYLFAIIETNKEYKYPGIKPAELEKVFAARDLIISNIAHHIEIPRIAKSVCLNECTLKYRFKQVMGKTMFEYLLYLRCLKVKELILTTDRPIKSFYREAGYTDLSNFLHGFKKHIGCYPSELQKHTHRK